MLQFGPFTLDATTGELRRDGQVVPLAPQPFRLLLALASRPGELVTREELRQQVWGDGTFVDFERGLNFCVLQARTALGDDAKEPQYIETLPRRGYRFVAAMNVAAPARVKAVTAVTALQTVAVIVFLLGGAWIAKGLLVETRPEESLTARTPAAHEAYLRGRQLWSEGTTPALQESVVKLREAVRLEPSYVLPHIALAESLHLLAMRERVDARAAAKEIRASSQAAMRLAPSLAQAHATEAMLRFWYEWNWEAAEESYRNAIRRNPNEPGALHDHGWLLLVRGRFAEGIAQIRRAQELDPISPRANMHVAWAYIYTGQYPQAVREARRALELSPGFQEAYHCLEDAYLLSGDYDSALAARKLRDPTVVGTDARKFFEADRATAVSRIEARNPYGAAVACALAGDREKALIWLRKAKETRNLSFPLAGLDPKLAILHGDARYVELLAGAGLRPLTPRSR
ncbi:MAG TPA: winged helix-turn-helix domain-containing protein [Thermoanaerobaculia bacterium]|nr:winged helix-turn-helix domain-containing protein [Thermoanaerobaculia bacterium]